MVLAELGRIRWNVVEYGGERQIAVDYRRLRQSRGRSLVAVNFSRRRLEDDTVNSIVK